MPIRSCISCGNRLPQIELLRIGQRQNGTVGPVSSPFRGRSAYICKSEKCVEAAFRKSRLAARLKTTLSSDELASVYREIECKLR